MELKKLRYEELQIGWRVDKWKLYVVRYLRQAIDGKKGSVIQMSHRAPNLKLQSSLVFFRRS
jgi:hypothetical protein